MQLCVVAYKITAYRSLTEYIVIKHTDPQRTAPTNRVMTPARVVVPRARLVMVSAGARVGRSVYRHMINGLSRSVVSRSHIVKTRSQHMN